MRVNNPINIQIVLLLLRLLLLLCCLRLHIVASIPGLAELCLQAGMLVPCCITEIMGTGMWFKRLCGHCENNNDNNCNNRVMRGGEG